MNRIAWALWWVAVVIQLLAQSPLLSAWQPLSQVLLMPILMLVVITRRPDSGWVLVWALGALFWSWLGDTGPKLVGPEWGFLTMLGGFFVAQLCWIVALLPTWRRSVLGRRRILLVPYVAVAGLLLGIALPASGSMAPFVVGYALVLLLMAVLATGRGFGAAVGGLLFIFSDGLIALKTFVPALGFAGSGFAVMLTYMLAQALLVHSIRGRRRISP
ncbi:lysoplasmalogenase family protein [Enemella sp. A6]|uniref:lysoplasmalogenase family protein n=1 Tax=Enemella sp. A6 TaxID=3440152 RepID=UPI003EB6BF4B